MSKDNTSRYSISIFFIATGCFDYLKRHFLDSKIVPLNLQKGATLAETSQAAKPYTSPFEPLRDGLREMEEYNHQIPRRTQGMLFYYKVGAKTWALKNLCAAHPPSVTRALLVLREAFEAEETAPVSIDQALGLMHFPAHFCFGESELLSARARRQLAEYLGTNTDNEGMPISLFFHTDGERTYTKFRVEGNAVFTLLPHELATLNLVVRDERLVAIDE